MPKTKVTSAYQALVAQGPLVDDPAQRQALLALDRFGERVAHGGAAKNPLAALLARRRLNREGRGIYLAGRVGRGKTMLMDLFFETAASPGKLRVHHADFMQEIHGRLYGLRKSARPVDAITAVAQAVAERARLLCLDEFQVKDIADAMLLKRLFEALIGRGVFMAVSSNTEPDSLYENGLNRQLFMPFIAFLKQRFEVVEIGGGIDYRLRRLVGTDAFVTPLGPHADAHMERLWKMLTDGEAGRPERLIVNGRMLEVPRAAHGAARFGFAELCEAPLGSADYLALARRFDTVFVENVPLLNGGRRDARLRMIALVDTLYDQQIRLAMSAAALPEALAPGDHDFERTTSRLQHMRASEYWQQGRQ
jgi:cell division protein ZapE